MMRTVVFPMMSSNYSAAEVVCNWTVEAIHRDLFGKSNLVDALPDSELAVGEYGLVRHSCAEFWSRQTITLTQKLSFKLPGLETTTVALVVDVRESLGKKVSSSALFSIAEHRSDGSSGGVVVAVTDEGADLLFPAIDLAPSPIPLNIIEGPFLLSRPIYQNTPASQTLDRAFGAGYLGVLVRNEGKQTLKSVVFYPECVSLSGVKYEPRVFDMDALDVGDAFFAAFPFDVSEASVGTGNVQFVGYASGFDRTRFAISARILDSRTE